MRAVYLLAQAARTWMRLLVFAVPRCGKRSTKPRPEGWGFVFGMPLMKGWSLKDIKPLKRRASYQSLSFTAETISLTYARIQASILAFITGLNRIGSPVFAPTTYLALISWGSAESALDTKHLTGGRLSDRYSSMPLIRASTRNLPSRNCRFTV
jgi:hypothetical protein